MQDIAGCRIVVDDVAEQDATLRQLQGLFPEARVTDRRAQPSFGYRAVHVIPEVAGKEVEIQLRTLAQDLWAAISERAADEFGQELKYGQVPAGAEAVRTYLDWTSRALAIVEEGQADFKLPAAADLRSFRMAEALAIMRLGMERDRLS